MQPIAAFASKGAASGEILCKLILSAIVKLEQCGALVDCVVCDGATTNKNVWKRFGISGDVGSPVTNKVILCNDRIISAFFILVIWFFAGLFCCLSNLSHSYA